MEENCKTFEENSSDMDDIEDKLTKRQIEITSSVASRRPVRKKTKRKNEDFEYDLSNLLKMEAQGYRDSQASTTNTKSTQNKKKSPQQDNQNYYDIINRDCCGALATMSKKSVEVSIAHIKNTSFMYVTPKDPRPSNIFVRPMIPKIISRTEKNSPKKDIVEDSKDGTSPQKELVVSNNITEEIVKESEKESKKITSHTKESLSIDQSTSNNTSSNVTDTAKNNANIPAVVPIKFRRQSLELIKNPIINKNITDFKKAGMKTKILVIKPINRNKDGTPVPNTPLKFQTIKLKDPSKSSSINEDKQSDQVMVVKVPKVETISRTVTDSNVINNVNTKPINTNALNNNIDSENVDNKNNTTETVPVNLEETNNVKTENVSNENQPFDDSKSVSEDKELILDTEIVKGVPDST